MKLYASMLLGLVFLFTSLVNPSLSQAGGGGCDGECPPEPPKNPLVHCEIIKIQNVNKSSLELDESVPETVSRFENGVAIVLRGDQKNVYSALVRFKTYKPVYSWIAYKGKDPIDLEMGSFLTDNYFKTRYSISMNDPRPLVTGFHIQLAKKPEFKTTKMRLLARGYFDPDHGWKSSTVTVFTADADCRPL